MSDIEAVQVSSKRVGTYGEYQATVRGVRSRLVLHTTRRHGGRGAKAVALRDALAWAKARGHVVAS